MDVVNADIKKQLKLRVENIFVNTINGNCSSATLSFSYSRHPAYVRLKPAHAHLIQIQL